MTVRRLLSTVLRLLAVLLVVTLNASAQNAGGKFADVTVWYGSYSYKVSATGAQGNGNVVGLFTGTFTLKQSAQGRRSGLVWEGKIENGHGSFHYTKTEQSTAEAQVDENGEVTDGTIGAACAETVAFHADGPTTQVDPSTKGVVDAQLNVYSSKWNMHITKTVLRGVEKRTGCISPSSQDLWMAFPIATDEFPLPPSGTDLYQRFTTKGTAIVPSPAYAATFQNVAWEGEIRLSPTRDEFVLEVETKDHTTGKDYKTWRPSATATGKPGAAIAFTATLKRKSGAPLGAVKVSKMVWELVDTSREPGVAINYPLNATDSNADMRFDPQAGQQSLDREQQKLTTFPVKNAIDTVSILPFDWGAWSTLRVTAYIDNGPEVVGKFIETGDEDIRLPRRRNQTFIADAWREKKTMASGDDNCLAGEVNARSGNDNGDDETDKELGGFPGDGLTLYEEYRGFYEKGQHKCGDPSKRDLFVIDETNDSVKGGIAKFAAASGIVVHSMRPDEFDKSSRIMNKNYRSSPHVLDQHGIRIVWMDSTEHKDDEDASGAFIATDPQNARSPGDVKYILIPRALPQNPAAADGTPYNDVSFAHEMMHAVGVRHHGDKKDFDVYWKIEGKIVKEYIQEADESLSGPGVEITILRQDGSNATSDFIAYRHSLGGKKAQGQKQSIGVKNGKGSGDDTCMMRYDRFSAYLIPGRPNVRVRIAPKENPEPVGYTICKRRNGTGINAPPPEKSRYGDASAGDCAGQMRVRDLN